MDDGPSTTGVVLAGGESRRFGRPDKATATLRGRPLVARVVERVAAATTATPLVAVRTPDQRSRLATAVETPVRFVFDADGFAGPLAGLVAAARTAETEALFVAGCDMPCVAPDAVRWLSRHYRDGDAADGVVPLDGDGRAQLLHALYATEAVAALDADVPGNRLHAALDRLRIRTVTPETAPDGVSLSRSVTNVNTRAALDALRAADAVGDGDDRPES